MAFMLEKEAEELGDWFAKEYPMGEFKVHLGRNRKDKYEEVNVAFSSGVEHFGFALRIPPGFEHQDRAFVDKYRAKFVEVVKDRIAKAFNSVIRLDS